MVQKTNQSLLCLSFPTLLFNYNKLFHNVSRILSPLTRYNWLKAIVSFAAKNMSMKNGSNHFLWFAASLFHRSTVLLWPRSRTAVYRIIISLQYTRPNNKYNYIIEKYEYICQTSSHCVNQQRGTLFFVRDRVGLGNTVSTAPTRLRMILLVVCYHLSLSNCRYGVAIPSCWIYTMGWCYIYHRLILHSAERRFDRKRYRSLLVFWTSMFSYLAPEIYNGCF